MNPMDRQMKIEGFRKRLADDPDGRIFAPLADLLRLEGQFEEALTLLASGLEKHPAYLSARVIQGRTLLDAGKVDRGRAVLRSVLDDDGENLVVLRLLAEEALGRGDRGEASPLLESLAVLDPEPEIWEAALRETTRDSGPVPAPAGDEPPAGDGRDADPSFATLTLVDIYLAQGYRDKARNALERILARDPDHREAADRLASFGEEPEVHDGKRPPLDAVLSGDEDPIEKRRRLTERRSQDKRKFEDWVSRLREDGSPTP